MSNNLYVALIGLTYFQEHSQISELHKFVKVNVWAIPSILQTI